MKNALLLLSFIFVGSLAHAQVLSAGNVAAYPKNMVSYSLDENGDTMASIMNYTCVIVAEKSFSSNKAKIEWDALKLNVKKVYPYAVLAKMKLAEMDSQLVLIKGERARSEFNQQCEKELTAQMATDMRNLTYSQAKILYKLLDRETGSTTYQIIKERRGGFQAFMWQGVAVVFGNNLKTDYDPIGEDANIEAVVQLIELGLI